MCFHIDSISRLIVRGVIFGRQRLSKSVLVLLRCGAALDQR